MPVDYLITGCPGQILREDYIPSWLACFEEFVNRQGMQ